MSSSDLINKLIEALRCLPGVGPKSARRMTYHMLERDREGASRLATTLEAALAGIGHCDRCRTLSESSLCNICVSEKRDTSLLCIVETPADLDAIENGADYNGRYFVLMGTLSPLDGISPEDLGMPLLESRLKSGGIAEIVIATGSTVEGQVTAYYLTEMAQEYGIKATRLAHGIPIGGDLEFVDSSTLNHAFKGRTPAV